MDEHVRLYVGNLPYVAQKEDIVQLFEESGIPVVKIDMAIDPFSGRNPSYCFVDLPSAEVAQKALEEMQGKVVGGRPVRLNYKTEKSERGPRPDTKTYDRGWGARSVPAKNTGPNAPAFDRWTLSDEAPNRWTAPTEEKRRLYVGGLPQINGQDVVDAQMRDLFREYSVEAVSKIISPHVSKQSQPGSHFYCFVDLASSTEAEDAARTLNGTSSPEGGNYRVSIAMPSRPTKVHREQGVSFQGQERPPRQQQQREQQQAPAPIRNLEGSWRRQN